MNSLEVYHAIGVAARRKEFRKLRSGSVDIVDYIWIGCSEGHGVASKSNGGIKDVAVRTGSSCVAGNETVDYAFIRDDARQGTDINLIEGRDRVVANGFDVEQCSAGCA